MRPTNVPVRAVDAWVSCTCRMANPAYDLNVELGPEVSARNNEKIWYDVHCYAFWLSRRQWGSVFDKVAEACDHQPAPPLDEPLPRSETRLHTIAHEVEAMHDGGEVRLKIASECGSEYLLAIGDAQAHALRSELVRAFGDPPRIHGR